MRRITFGGIGIILGVTCLGVGFVCHVAVWLLLLLLSLFLQLHVSLYILLIGGVQIVLHHSQRGGLGVANGIGFTIMLDSPQ